MPLHHPHRLAALITLAATAAFGPTGPARAGTNPVHRCDEGGHVVYSDRPCLQVQLGHMGGFGPADATAAPGRAPRAAKPPPPAPAHLKHLGAECAQMHERIRLGPSRQVPAAQVKAWRQDYQQRCQAAEAQARRQWRQETAAAGKHPGVSGSVPGRLASTVAAPAQPASPRVDKASNPRTGSR